MDKVKDFIKSKKGISFIIILIVFIIICSIISINNRHNYTLKCSKTDTTFPGFIITDEYKFKAKNSKIVRIKGKKSITIEADYSKDKTYKKIINSSLTNAYSYLDDVKVNENDNLLYVDIDTKDKGIILNNFNISLISDNNPNDIRFNTINNLESATKVVKINSSYDKKDLFKYMEGEGYTCK